MSEAKKYYATTSIGYNLKRGRPLFIAGDEIPANYSGLADLIKNGLASQKKPTEDQSKLLDRPITVPISPIHADISSAEDSNKKENDAQRVLAQSLSSVTEEQADKIAKEKQALLNSLAVAPKDNAKSSDSDKKPNTNPVIVADSGNHATANTDKAAVVEDLNKADQSAVKEAADTVRETEQQQEEANESDADGDDKKQKADAADAAAKSDKKAIENASKASSGDENNEIANATATKSGAKATTNKK